LKSALAAFRWDELAVVHAAALMSGDDALHGAQTVAPTHHLIEAMLQARVRRLVLLSSLSVYGYVALPEGVQLDETSPLETDTAGRDAYCRAKLAQETLVLAAAQTRGLHVTSLRAGAMFGPGRLWTSRIGIAKGGLGLVLGGNARVPLSYVEHCAEAALLAAERKQIISDVRALPAEGGRAGAFEAINVVDDDLPTQRQYAMLLRRNAGGPATLLRLPWGLLKKAGAAFALAGLVMPRMVSKLPAVLRQPAMHARIKPLRYSNCRLHDRLGWRPQLDCANAVAASALGTDNPSAKATPA